MRAHTHTHVHKYAHTHVGAIGRGVGTLSILLRVQLKSFSWPSPSRSTHCSEQLLLAKSGTGSRDTCNSSPSCANSRPQGLVLESSVGTSWRLYHSLTPPQTPVTWREPKSSLASRGPHLFLEAGNRGQRWYVYIIALGCQDFLAEVSELWQRWYTAKCRAKEHGCQSMGHLRMQHQIRLLETWLLDQHFKLYFMILMAE